MSRSALQKMLTAVLVLTFVGLAGRWWWTRDQLVEAGDVVVVVEGRSLSLGESHVGTGVAGTLALVGDRCVGFRGRDGGTVIVWPPDTEVTGEGEDIRISTGGTTVRLGDRVEGGRESMAFPDLEDRLHEVCPHLPVLAFDPNG